MTANRVNLMIVNGMVLTMDHELRQIRNGTVAIKGDTIAAVGPSVRMRCPFRILSTVQLSEAE